MKFYKEMTLYIYAYPNKLAVSENDLRPYYLGVIKSKNLGLQDR